MPERRAYPIRCATPTCYNDAWMSKNLFICGPCAEGVMYAMRDKVDQRVRQKVRDSFFELNATIRQHEQTIRGLQHLLDVSQIPRTVPTDGVVYYVQIGAHIKIGWTSNLENRMRQYPPNSTLLALHPGTRKDENRMHRRFAADRTHGREWYVPSASLTHHIAQVVRENGQPDAVIFGAKPVQIPMPHRTQSQAPSPAPRAWAV